ncbi:MAG: CDC27 family protein [Tannerellaceae bacterium]
MDDISQLLDRFLFAKKEGKAAYFDADEIDDLLIHFDEDDDNENYAEALTLGLKLHPDNMNLKIKQCRQYLDEEELISAEKMLKTLSDPGNVDLDMVRLEFYTMSNRFCDVMTYTNQLIADDCEYLEDIFEELVPEIEQLGQEKWTLIYLNLGLTLFPNNLELLDNRCFYLESKGQLKEAAQVCNQMIDQNPYSSEYWLMLGHIYSLLADFDKSIEAYDFAITCNESNSEIKMLKAYCLYMNDNLDKAIETYLEVDPNAVRHISIPDLVAECYIKQGKYEESYQTVKDRMLEIKASNKCENETDETFINYAHACVETGRLHEAAETIETANKLFPKNQRILFLLLMLYMDEHRARDADEIEAELINMYYDKEYKDPNDDENLFQAAQLYFLRGNLRRAAKYYDRILALNSRIPYIRIYAAIAYLSINQTGKFRAQYSLCTDEEIIEYMKRTGVKITKEDLHQTQENGMPVPPDIIIRTIYKDPKYNIYN